MRTGHLAAVTLLLDAGADLALLDNAGWSALRYAESRVEPGYKQARPSRHTQAAS